MRSRLSIIPRLVTQMMEQMERPHRYIDQHFGLGINPEQFFGPSTVNSRRFIPESYYRSWVDMVEDEEQNQVTKRDKFHVALDVQQFKPEEINVKIVDNYVVVEGKHEAKQDDHGIISRHFVRKYKIPNDYDSDKTASTLSYNGILTITAPLKPEAIENKQDRVIKIEKVGKSKSDNKIEEPQIEKQKIAQNQ